MRPSDICSPMLITGLSAVIGSWKIRPMSRPRSLRISRSGRPAISRPASRIERAVTFASRGASPMIASAVMDLPNTRLPAIASVSPASREKSSSSTARKPGKATVKAPTSRTGWRGGIAQLLVARRGLSTSFNASPNRLSASTVMTMAMPGMALRYQAVRSSGRALADHRTPRHHVRIAEAQERERRFHQDRGGEQDRRGDDDRRQSAGQDLRRHDPQVAIAEAARGENEIPLAELTELGAHDACGGRPCDDGDRQHDCQERRLRNGDQHDQKDEVGRRLHDLDQLDDQHVGPAAEIAGESSGGEAGDYAQPHREEADEQGNPCAPGEPCRHIAPERVGAERKGRVPARAR